MKTCILLLLLFPASFPALACTTCNRSLQKAITASASNPGLTAILLPFILLGIITIVLYFLSLTKIVNPATDPPVKSIIPLAAASAIIGIGIGGFIDGILFHQLLQWHEMLSNKIPPATLLKKSVNMFWDGVFHSFTLCITLVGIIALYKLLSKPGIACSNKLLSGGLLLGWGIFNLIEGATDHLILKLHNVREITTHVSAWNYGFLLFSILLILIAYLIIKTAYKQLHTHDSYQSKRTNHYRNLKNEIRQ